jgi:hypothetical protein
MINFVYSFFSVIPGGYQGENEEKRVGVSKRGWAFHKISG